MIDPDKFYSLKEAVPDYTGTMRTATFAHIRKGNLRATRIGRTLRLLGADLIAFRERLQKSTPSHH